MTRDIFALFVFLFLSCLSCFSWTNFLHLPEPKLLPRQKIGFIAPIFIHIQPYSPSYFCMNTQEYGSSKAFCRVILEKNDGISKGGTS